MVCLYCNSPTQVKNSRLQKRANQVWRRRQCIACSSNYTTHEIPDYGSTIMVKYTTRTLDPFSRDLLFVSIFESCKHRKTALADASALTLTIIGELIKIVEDGSLERDTIVAVAAAVLERFDTAAATMYTAYHPLRA